MLRVIVPICEQNRLDQDLAWLRIVRALVRDDPRCELELRRLKV